MCVFFLHHSWSFHYFHSPLEQWMVPVINGQSDTWGNRCCMDYCVIQISWHFLLISTIKQSRVKLSLLATYWKGSINFQALSRIPGQLSCSDLSSWSPDRNMPIPILQGLLQPVVTQLKLQMIVASSQSLDQRIFLLKKNLNPPSLFFFLSHRSIYSKKREYRNIWFNVIIEN